jgi:hypothetical protein
VEVEHTVSRGREVHEGLLVKLAWNAKENAFDDLLRTV